jgi:curved DNA-binding protein CbpA
MEMSKKLNYYEYFGLPNFENDQAKIKKAYRAMALKHHPDRGGSTYQMKQVNEVYRVLSRHKDDYDHHLRIKMGLISPVVSVRVFNFYKPY